MNLSPDHIISLAPDPGTAQRAKTVAHRQRWHSLEGNERAIWGTLGNPADPYRTQVDFRGPAFSCSCPVRRKPCKHGIGLLLLFAKNNDAFQVVTDPPDWVNSWLEKRDERSIKKPEQPPQRSREEEEVLAEKRRQSREKRLYQMAAGMAELESWLTDLFRQGLASLEGQSHTYWSELAARMVDAKLGGIARRIRRFPLLMGTADWHARLLGELGDIYLMVKGFQNKKTIPEPLLDDLLSLSGMNFKKDEVLAGEGLHDLWLVAGQTEEQEEGNLTARRTWFAGEQSGRTVLLLDFAWGGNAYETSWTPGTVVNGEVAFYPSAFPQRVLFKKFEYADQPYNLNQGYDSFAGFAGAFAQAIGMNPWLGLFPAFLRQVIPVFQNDRFLLVDKNRKQIPVLTTEESGWKMVASGSGRPNTIFGTWNGEYFHPLSIVDNGKFQSLHAGTHSIKTTDY